jgi:hypothetical protein
LPKTQVVGSEDIQKAIGYAGEVIFPSDEVLPEEIPRQDISFMNESFGVAPRLTILPEKDGRKLVEQNNRLIIVNTEVFNIDSRGCNGEALNSPESNEVTSLQEKQNKKKCI